MSKITKEDVKNKNKGEEKMLNNEFYKSFLESVGIKAEKFLREEKEQFKEQTLTDYPEYRKGIINVFFVMGDETRLLEIDEDRPSCIMFQARGFKNGFLYLFDCEDGDLTDKYMDYLLVNKPEAYEEINSKKLGATL